MSIKTTSAVGRCPPGNLTVLHSWDVLGAYNEVVKVRSKLSIAGRRYNASTLCRTAPLVFLKVTSRSIARYTFWTLTSANQHYSILFDE